ncbi:MAG: GGGtGRT protein, partial [Oscillospiraceae bacterium]
MAKFEGQERRMPKIEACLKEYGLTTLDEARELCLSKGVDVETIV